MSNVDSRLTLNNPTTNKLLYHAIERNMMINSMTSKEKVEYIKRKYNLTHGKGKRKKHKKHK